jgi:hypothetical protein
MLTGKGQSIVIVLVFVLMALSSHGRGQELCAEGTLLEPYSGVCAPINDRRAWWLTPSGTGSSWSVDQEPPEAGAINAGTTYLAGALSANTSARLHTRMFVHPNGLSPSGFLDWTFTTATNRVDSAVEVVAIYRTALGDSGVLSIFGRPCSEEYPCPDGDTSNGWQPSKYFSELNCNITHIVDDGGHAQKIVHYANHSDRLDDEDPALWKNAVYLWNYCDEQWDLIWEHSYRENKRDCSVEGCYWWGTGIELPGASLRPQVVELGFEDTLLYHDGTWSELRPDETGFRNPEDSPELSPWQLFHLDPNRSFGAGSFLNENDAPTIVGQELLATPEDTALALGSADLVVSDPDVDPAYHSDFKLSIFGGQNYTFTDSTITPSRDFFGDLQVPVSVSDGAAESVVFNLLVTVEPVDDPPDFVSTAPVNASEGSAYTYAVQTMDPDGEAAVIDGPVMAPWLSLADHGDSSATLSGIPAGSDVGSHPVTIRATDSSGLVATQSFTITVSAVPTKRKSGGGSFGVIILMTVLLAALFRQANN